MEVGIFSLCKHAKSRGLKYEKLVFDWIAKQKHPPTCRQVREALSISKGTAWKYCKKYQQLHGIETVKMEGVQ